MWCAVGSNYGSTSLRVYGATIAVLHEGDAYRWNPLTFYTKNGGPTEADVVTRGRDVYDIVPGQKSTGSVNVYFTIKNTNENAAC